MEWKHLLVQMKAKPDAYIHNFQIMEWGEVLRGVTQIRWQVTIFTYIVIIYI